MAHFTRLMILLVIVAAALAGCDPGPHRVYIRDADNRIVIHHGVNASNTAKAAPDHLPWQTREDFARLRDWGFNLVRYTVFWEGVEPEQGVYDEAYLDATVERIGWLEELGIDVLVDFHQDLYSRRFGGNGFPDWSIHDGGFEFTPRQPWSLNYFEPAVIASYTAFWRSDALRQAYIDMLAHMLERIEGLPNVIGLDIMNEPFPGLACPFESGVLSRFYEEVLAMRHVRGFTTPLYFEPMIYTSGGLRSKLRFKPDAHCVYAPHYYDPLCHEGFAYDARARWMMRAILQRRVREARRFDVPMTLCEWGMSSIDGYLDYLKDFTDLADEYGFGWAYWSYDTENHSAFGLLDGAGNPRPHLTRLVRVYPQRIAGDNPKWGTDGHVFTLSYKANESTAPTVIFVPPALTGVQATHNEALLDFTDGQRILTVANDGGLGANQFIRVTWEGAAQ